MTFDKSDARSLLAGEDVVHAYGPTNRNIPNLLRNLVARVRVVRRVRPRVIVTTGAGVAVPFAWIGRMFGARVVYVESFTRIEGPSLSCRLIAPVASASTRSGPSSPARIPGALRGNVFPARRDLVTVGTNEARFDRLLAAAGALPGDEELVIQHGPSRVDRRRAHASTSCRSTSWSSRCGRRASRHARRRRLGHGRALERQPPDRRAAARALGEAVDDHRCRWPRRAGGAGQLVEDLDRLRDTVLGRTSAETVGIAVNERLVADLRELVVRAAGPPG